MAHPGVAEGNIFVYFGPLPNFTECSWDATSLGGPLGTYAQTLAFIGGAARVLGISLVVDGGWTHPRGQAVDVDNSRVNSDVLRGMAD
jgi:hypothetical protein